MTENHRPIPAVREEIGIDYVYRCGYLLCDKTISSYFSYCPYCGTKIDWENTIDANKRTTNKQAVRRKRRLP